MNNNPSVRNLGEIKLIKLIEELILKKTGKALIRDDSFFFSLKGKKLEDDLILNSDMLVSTTDVPPHMNFYQIGWKSVLMNLSDLIVKGVKPQGIVISLGLPRELKKENFIDMVTGMIECSLKFKIDYIGGDINETKELIINPTIFGFKNPSKIIYRKGIRSNDFLSINNKFGLTGVGFDILLKRKGDIKNFSNYKRSLQSVLEPNISEREAFILSERRLATSSIDSSDGLAKSLLDLMASNPQCGFEIIFDDNLIDAESVKFSKEFNVPLENLIFNGGEEFIHLFTIKTEDFSKAQEIIQAKGGNLFKIGLVIPEENIYTLKKNKRNELNIHGFEHFNQ